ncbi:ABC transporter substrate-binding protein [Synoicihabitans lomoniglobus]|uniref:ABC transporter substrate-binding protein n=1 Tax=Synoicihabitans lomoniglobus TaxID=2909285 RepID=A0AAF0I2M1_9BACT|nr:ABC transporter substrate-binding protein [Opitutaceae bacterium LMO-M01]WED66612.1 ABC transporter substrate-binding protein [Opitutaceae bacterium LMO-M01]
MTRLSSLCATAAAVLFAAGCGKSPPPTTQTDDGSTITAIRFQTDWYPQAEHGGFYQALATGGYAESGLDVTILPGGPGPTATTKLASGAADIAMGRSDDIMRNIADGLPFVIVGAFMQHDPQALLLHAANPVTRFEDLDGKTIMAIPGSNWINVLKARYQIDFSIIPTNFGIAQFMGNPEFIQQCFVTNEPFYVAQNGAKPKTMLLADTGFDPYRVIFTKKAFLRDHPEAVKAFVAASTAGWRDYIEGDSQPGNALIQARNDQMSDAFIAFSIQTMRDNGLIGGNPTTTETYGQLLLSRMEATMATMVELKLISQPLDLNAVVAFDMVAELPAP